MPICTIELKGSANGLAVRHLFAQYVIRGVLAGETELFSELIQPCEKRIRTVVRYALGNRAEADDIAQETRLKAFKHLRQFRQEASFRTWVSRIAANEANQFLRRRSLTLARSIENEAGPTDKDVTESRASAYELVLQTEMSSTVRRAIRKLPEAMQTVVVLRDLEDLTNAEAAVRLGLTATAVKTRHFRARLRLRRVLTDYYRRTIGPSSKTKRRYGTRKELMKPTDTSAESAYHA